MDSGVDTSKQVNLHDKHVGNAVVTGSEVVFDRHIGASFGPRDSDAPVQDETYKPEARHAHGVANIGACLKSNGDSLHGVTQSLCPDLLLAIVRASRVPGISPQEVGDTLEAVLHSAIPNLPAVRYISRHLMSMNSTCASSSNQHCNTNEVLGRSVSVSSALAVPNEDQLKDIQDLGFVIKEIIRASSGGNGWILGLLTPFLVSALSTNLSHTRESEEHPVLMICSVLGSQNPSLVAALARNGFGEKILDCVGHDDVSNRLLGNALHQFLATFSQLDQFCARIFIRGIASDDGAVRALVMDGIHQVVKLSCDLELLAVQNRSMLPEFMGALLLAAHDPDIFTSGSAREFMVKCNFSSHFAQVLDMCVNTLISHHLNTTSLSRQAAAAAAFADCMIKLQPSQLYDVIRKLFDLYDSCAWKRPLPSKSVKVQDVRWILPAKQQPGTERRGILSRYNIDGLEKAPVMKDMDLSVLRCRKQAGESDTGTDRHWPLRRGVAIYLKSLATGLGQRVSRTGALRQDFSEDSKLLADKAGGQDDCATQRIACLQEVFSWLLAGPTTDGHASVAQSMTEAACEVVDAGGPDAAPRLFELLQESSLSLNDANSTTAGSAGYTLILGRLAAYFDAQDPRLVPAAHRLLSMTHGTQEALLLQARSLSLLAPSYLASIADPREVWEELCELVQSSHQSECRGRAFALVGVVAGAREQLVEKWKVFQTLQVWTASAKPEQRRAAMYFLLALILFNAERSPLIGQFRESRHHPGLYRPISSEDGSLGKCQESQATQSEHQSGSRLDVRPEISISSESRFVSGSVGMDSSHQGGWEAYIVSFVESMLKCAGDSCGSVGEAARECCKALSAGVSVSASRLIIPCALKVLPQLNSNDYIYLNDTKRSSLVCHCCLTNILSRVR